MNYWISTPKLTVRVKTDARHTVIEAAPVVKRFLGQPVANLLKWASKQGEMRVEKS